MSETASARIVVVDDDEVKRYRVTHVLAKAGFAVVEASNGLEALEAAASDPDLMILDVNLPDVDGFEVCRRIKSDPRTASIIVLHVSAVMTQTADRVHGLEEGADGYIIEPVDTRELIATVRSMLRVRYAERVASALAGQWQSTFDAITDGVCVTDAAGAVLRTNAAMSERLERAGGGQLLERVESLCGRARESDRREVEEFRIGDRWVRATADPTHDDAGAVEGAVFIARDVTAEKRAEEKRAELLAREQELRVEAETINRAKDEFLATISHELRTPLNSILGWLSLMRTGRLETPMYERALDTIERNAKSQAQLVADILDVSRIIRGEMRLHVRKLALGPIVGEAVESVRPAAEAKGIDLVVDLDDGAGEISGDPDRLQQIVWNLLSNAIKFTPRGGRVEVRLARVEDHVVVVVRDTGIGIEPKFLPYVFERFRQADSSTTRVYSGLGLGLAIVRHLVELHGGTVDVESDGPGRGAAFTVRIPASGATAEDAEVAGEPSEAEGPSGEFLSLDGVRVLIVDDEADTRAMLETVLEHCDAEVRTCASARDALAVLASWTPDVIVSDIGMPGQDGISLIQAIRDMGGEGAGLVPAIALTAYASARDRERVLDAGFQVHMTKPADPAAVVAEIARLAGERDRGRPR
jgi:signal transduction histidine kinase